MVTKEIIINEIVNYANTKINSIANESVLFDILFKPFITEVVNVNIAKLDSALSLVTNDEGLINAEKLINDIVDNLVVAPVKNIKGINVGDGKVEINLPMIGGSVVFDRSDFEELKTNINKHIVR